MGVLSKLEDDRIQTQDGAKAEKAKKRLVTLRDSQGVLFMSGMFLTLFFGFDFLSTSPHLDPFLLSVLPLAEALLLVFGFILLVGGLVEAHMVVSYFSGDRPKESRDLLKLTVSPFLIFNVILLYEYATSAASMGVFGAEFILVWFAILTASYISLKWLNYLFSEQWRSPRGLFAAFSLVAPYVSVFIYYYLTHGFG